MNRTVHWRRLPVPAEFWVFLGHSRTRFARQVFLSLMVLNSVKESVVKKKQCAGIIVQRFLQHSVFINIKTFWQLHTEKLWNVKHVRFCSTGLNREQISFSHFKPETRKWTGTRQWKRYGFKSSLAPLESTTKSVFSSESFPTQVCGSLSLYRRKKFRKSD